MKVKLSVSGRILIKLGERHQAAVDCRCTERQIVFIHILLGESRQV